LHVYRHKTLKLKCRFSVGCYWKTKPLTGL
jgi:hypothetical protein